MILPPDYEARTVELVWTYVRDIPECNVAKIEVVFIGQNPALRFMFGGPIQFKKGDKAPVSRPTLTVGLVAESRKNPLAPGRLLGPEQLQRQVRPWIEEYMKLNGIEISTKVVTDACL